MLTLLATILTHPGSGLEINAAGHIYLADVARETIWRIELDGGVNPWVTNAWTHEFHLQGNTLIYEREHTGYEQAPQSLHAITDDGEHTRLFAPPPDRSRFNGSAFARAPDGSVVFTQTVRGEENSWYSIIRQRDADDRDGSRVRVIAGATSGPMYKDGLAEEATFRMILDMRRLDDGTLVVLDRDRVRRISPDGPNGRQVTTQGPSLIDARPADPPTRGGPTTTWNRLYGIEVEPDGSALVCYNAGRRVIRVKPDGTTESVYESSNSWAPLGVALGPEGRIHISELSDRGSRLRVVRLDGDGNAVPVATVPPN